MFSKRPDKHTTGLINLRNDCFANSSLQAYASLPALTVYLNLFIKEFNNLMTLIQARGLELNKYVQVSDIDLSLVRRKNGNCQLTAKDFLSIPLHIALARMLLKLQETQMTTRTISVWTFLHELEKIYDSKISKSQHDAQELTQLINETLENENDVCKAIYQKLKAAASAIDEIDVQLVSFPKFPFSGLLRSQMTCLSCSYVSKPSVAPFTMLTLHPPQEIKSDVESLLKNHGKEEISDYKCLKCRLLAFQTGYMANKESFLGFSEQEQLKRLIALNSKTELHINEDLPPELENTLQGVKSLIPGIDNVTSTVERTTEILKPPKVLGLHLSRSTFNGVSVERNPCRVEFGDKIGIEFDQRKLKEQLLEMSNTSHKTQEKKFNVLTRDQSDVEIASVNDSIQDYGHSDASESAISDYSLENELQTSPLSTSLEIEHENSTTDKSTETLPHPPGWQESQNSSLIFDSSEEERKHLEYKLKSLIRHQGSHTQGHYECYRRKPVFIKDSDGNVIKMATEIDMETLKEALRHSGDLSLESGTSMTETEDKSALREKLSAIIGRRPSILQADPKLSKMEEEISSGLTTPAEVMVSQDSYFHPSTASPSDKPEAARRMRMRKLRSTIKTPFWRIGDSTVSEVAKSTVLFETGTAYMLYYERLN